MIIEKFLKDVDITISTLKDETDDYLVIGICKTNTPPGQAVKSVRELIVKSTEFGVKVFVESDLNA